MNVYFPSAETDSAKQSINVDRATTAYRTSTRNAERAGRSSFALDISGTVTDNSAYAGHGRTAEEVMRMAGQEDTKARRDSMAVMSNCMSDEDFAKLQEEGFHPGSTEIDTVVTIVDRIKAALVKGGTEVVGYTDTLSDEELCKITGSESFANELKNQFHDRLASSITLTRRSISSRLFCSVAHHSTPPSMGRPPRIPERANKSSSAWPGMGQVVKNSWKKGRS